MPVSRALGIAAVVGLAAGCGGLQSRGGASSAELGPTIASGAEAPSSPAPQAPAPAAREQRPGRPRSAGAMPIADAASAPSEPEPAPSRPSPRKVVYEAWCRLKSPHPEATIDAAIREAETRGGYVESRSQTTAVLRVPVATLRDAFAAMLELGVVLERRMTARDVTDQVTDLALREQTLRAARDRLQELLGQAKTEQQKLQLLRDISRLTEQIDQIALQLGTLERLAAFSRIVVEATGARPEAVPTAVDDVAGLRWLRSLSPFQPIGADRRLEVPIPAGMVELEGEGAFRAQAADGAFVRASRRKNEPAGSTSFWTSAVRVRLGPEFAANEALELGAFSGVRFVHSNDASYRYLVAFRVDGRWLHVVEIYFPTAESEARHRDAVIAALTEVEAS